jgi:hypothetical protein
MPLHKIRKTEEIPVEAWKAYAQLKAEGVRPVRRNVQASTVQEALSNYQDAQYYGEARFHSFVILLCRKFFFFYLN